MSKTQLEAQLQDAASMCGFYNNILSASGGSELDKERLYHWQQLYHEYARQLAAMGSGVIVPADGTKGVDINGGYEWINGQKIYDSPHSSLSSGAAIAARAGNYPPIYLDPQALAQYNRMAKEEMDSIITYRKCDCGAEKVHGSQASEALHATWCTLISE